MRFLLLASCVALAACLPHEDTPLSRAAAAGDLDQIRRLAPSAPADGRDAALIRAARSGQPASIALLVKLGANPNAVAGVNYWPALMHAVHKSQRASVEALLNAGANIEAADPHGGTALMMAAGYGYTDLARLLLARGANPRRRNEDGETALDLAAHGVFELDRLTWGTCQVETVRLLQARAPDLQSRSAGACH
jgi:hypothetical protein